MTSHHEREPLPVRACRANQPVTRMLSAVCALGLAALEVFGAMRGAAAEPVVGAPMPIPVEVYRARRARLAAHLPAGTVAILAAPPSMRDGERPHASFLYLTGIDEAGAVLVLAPGETQPEQLFLAPRDPEVERWDGERAPLGDAFSKRLGFKRVQRTTALPGVLARLSTRVSRLAFLGPVAPINAPVSRELEMYGRMQARAPWLRVEPFVGLIEAQRAIKDAHELARIRRATDITVEAHLAVWRAVRAGMTERQVKLRFESELLRRGARRVAYPSIVGSGSRAAVLHSSRDDGVIGANDLVLIDAGAEVGGYATDVTRTIPVSGRFTPEQRKIYDVVLAAQKAALAVVRPGVRLRDIHKAAREVIARAGHADAFPHGTSHFVGLRVHDAGDAARPLEAGMVLTVEPGIYYAARGIGVRIEDTIVVTAAGHENLSAKLPKEPDEIERFFAARPRGAP